jgi:hypothetical protein
VPIAEDASSPAAVSTTSATTITTASFSPPGSSLLLALVSSDGAAGTATTCSVSDSGSHTWSLLKRQNTNTSSAGGSCEIWVSYQTNAPGSITVTAQQMAGTANGMLLAVKALTGAAATQNGATAGAQNNSGAPTLALTTTRAGSMVYGALGDFSGSTTFTANGATTVVAQLGDSVNANTYVTCKSSSATGTPGATTFGFTAPATCAFNFGLAEILPAAGLVAALYLTTQAIKRASLW